MYVPLSSCWKRTWHFSRADFSMPPSRQPTTFDGVFEKRDEFKICRDRQRRSRFVVQEHWLLCQRRRQFRAASMSNRMDLHIRVSVDLRLHPFPRLRFFKKHGRALWGFADTSNDLLYGHSHVAAVIFCPFDRGIIINIYPRHPLGSYLLVLRHLRR